MIDFFNHFWLALGQLQGWEVLAMLLGLVYIVLAIRENAWAWPAAFVSTAIYTGLFWGAQLPLQAALNFYYLGMAAYGFWLWRQPRNSGTFTAIATRSFGFHIKFILLGLLLSLAFGWLNSLNEWSKWPLLDAFVLVFSVMNTLLMAQKILENWLYWLVVDTVAIVLYWQAEFYVTIILFIVYVVMAVVGYREWRAKLQAQLLSDT